MKLSDYLVRFYPEVDVLQYPWVYHDRYEHYLPKEKPSDTIGHQRTGPMDLGRFNRLKDDIAANGIECPFIIEFYRKDLPNARGLREESVLAIRTGNNRAEAMQQLGLRLAPALFVVPREVIGQLPSDVEFEDLPMGKELGSAVSRLWRPVVRGNDEPLGESDAWMDCELLTDLVRLSKDVV